MPEQGSSTYESGAWEINLARRELRLRGEPVPLGGRAFDIIEVLIQAAGELVTKDDLMSRVWPDVIVGDNTLQVHVWAVRKALGADRWMLKTASGRGYRLLGDWWGRQDRAVPIAPAPAQPRVRAPLDNLPAPGAELIGRDAVARQLRDLLTAYRVVTLTGPGGIGKTTLALKVAHLVLGEFADGGWLVELASLSDSGLVPSAVAQALRLTLGGGDITAETVARTIGDRHLLLVVDNCEHLIGAVTTLVEMILRLCPRVTILTTSREVLRTQGEYVYRVPPLVVPAPEESEATAILGRGAAELFIARAQELGSDFSSNATNLTTIAAICRHLDGIPLAIEFAAARAATLGLDLVAAGLRDRLALLTSGRRTALPRHRTLRAALDWSYELLPEEEQRLLRWLAVFPGGFTVDAAVALMRDAGGDGLSVMDAITELVAKSLVTFDGTEGGGGRWRLLETIRAYALQKLTESGELEAAQRQHATHFRDLLALPPDGASSLSRDDLARYVREIDNVRAALDWSFSSPAHAAIATELTAAYVPVWMTLSLAAECLERCEHALLRLSTEQITDDRLRMWLRIGLGSGLLHTFGPAERTQTVLTEALAIADSLNDLAVQLRVLLILSSVNVFRGEYTRAAAEVERAAAIAQRIGDTRSVVVAARRMGTTLLTIGKLGEARRWLEQASRSPPHLEEHQLPVARHSDDRAMARAMLARALWLQGFPDRARGEAQASIDDVRDPHHQLTMCRVLYFGLGRIAPMTGEFAAAEDAIATLIELATRMNARFWMTAGQFLRGKLLVERQAYAEGLVVLREAFEICRQTGWRLSYPEFTGSLALALAGLGQFDEASDAVARAIESAGGRADGQQWYVPELLRINGEILLRRNEPGTIPLAEACFEQAAAMAIEQGALFWELRVALGHARLRIAQGRRTEATRILAPVHDRFTEGFATLDMRSATELLRSLSASHPDQGDAAIIA